MHLSNSHDRSRLVCACTELRGWDDYVRTQDRKGNGAVLPFISLITMSALLILKRSNSNVKHLVWPDACSAGHLTPGLPELPVAPDPQQQPGRTESSQTALTCGSRVTNNFLCWDISCCNYSMGRRATLRPAARPGALQRFARHQLPLCTHCLHQISPTPLPFPLSNAWSLFSTRLSKEEKKTQKCSKTLVYLQTSCSPFKTQTSRASSHNSQAAYQQRAPKEQRQTK